MSVNLFVYVCPSGYSCTFVDGNHSRISQPAGRSLYANPSFDTPSFSVIIQSLNFEPMNPMETTNEELCELTLL